MLLKNKLCLAVLAVLMTGCSVQNVKYYYREAVSAERKGDLANALKNYTELLKLDERYFAAVYNLGNVYYRQKNYKKARVQFAKAIQLRTNYSDAYYNLALTYVQLKQYPLAFDAFEAYQKSVPGDYRGWLDHGVLLMMDGKPQLAVKQLLKGLQKNPTNVSLLYNTGFLYWQQQDVTNAYKYLKKAAAVQSNIEAVNVMLVRSATAMGRLNDAENYLKILVKYSKESRHTKISGAEIAYLKKQYPQALKTVNSVLDDYPDFAPALVLKGRIYGAQNKKLEAIKYFELAVQSEPFDLKYRIEFADMLKNTGRLTKARLTLAEVSRAYPDETGIRQRLLEIYYLQGHYDKAISLGKKMIAADPRDREVQYYLGISYVKTDDFSLRDTAKAVQLLWPLRYAKKTDKEYLRNLKQALVEQKQERLLPELERISGVK